MEDSGRNSVADLRAELAKLEQALADVRLEREVAGKHGYDCNDLVGHQAAWDRDERVLLERIAALKQALQ